MTERLSDEEFERVLRIARRSTNLAARAIVEYAEVRASRSSSLGEGDAANPNPVDPRGPTHWGPRFDAEFRCLRHKEHPCPSCLAYALGDANARASAAEKALAASREEGRREGREEAARRAEAEEELDGEIPEAVRCATYRDPAGALRSVVRATKRGIAEGIRALSSPGDGATKGGTKP